MVKKSRDIGCPDEGAEIFTQTWHWLLATYPHFKLGKGVLPGIMVGTWTVHLQEWKNSLARLCMQEALS